jgi:heptaprenyl diphosphate synthase
MIRIVLGSLVTGRLFSPVFILAITGGFTSLIVMHILIKTGRRWFSMLGISVCGALAHNMTQLVTVYVFYIQSTAVFSLAWLFVLTAVAAGSLIGIAAGVLDEKTGGLILSGS